MAGSNEFRGLIAQLYTAEFSTAQSMWVEEFLVLLLKLRETFGNDLDKVIILSTIGQRRLRDPAMPALSHAEAVGERSSEWTGAYTNVDALARATGIPRESVRRKVNELIADQLVVRNEAGGLTVNPGAAARLAPATMVTIEMLDRVVSGFIAMLRDRGALVASAPQPIARTQV